MTGEFGILVDFCFVVVNWYLVRKNKCVFGGVKQYDSRVTVCEFVLRLKKIVLTFC